MDKLQQALEAQRAQTDELMTGGFRGLFGLRGQRMDRQQAATRSLAAETELQQQMGMLASLQASGVNTRQIPGIGQALANGGENVANALLTNPLTPYTQSIQPMVDTSREAAIRTSTAALQKAEADAAAAGFDARRKEADWNEFNSFAQTNSRYWQGMKQAEDAYRAANGMPVAGPNERVAMNPYTRQEMLVPMPGTPAYIEQNQKGFMYQETMKDLQAIIDLIDSAGPTGTEYSGVLAKQIDRQFANIVFDIKNAEELGAITKEDAELALAGLINPTDFTENMEGLARALGLGLPGLVAGNQKDAILAGYRQAMGRYADRLEAHYRSNPYIDVNPAWVGPEFMQRLQP